MLSIAAALISLCPLILEPPWPKILTAEVYFAHQAEDAGTPYMMKAEHTPVVSVGIYTVDSEGHPVGVKWSDGTFCGGLPARIFADGFETGTIERWKTGG